MYVCKTLIIFKNNNNAEPVRFKLRVNKRGIEVEEKSCKIEELIGSLCQVFVLKLTEVKQEQPEAILVCYDNSIYSSI